MIKRFINPYFGAVLLLSFALQAHAQTQAPPLNKHRYGSWSPSSTDTSQVPREQKLQNLINELNALIDAAQRDRAANRLFLRDLKDLTARYANPWSQRVLFDNFTDGDYTRDPVWSVTSGDYFVEQGYGLRARAPTVPATRNTKSQKISKEQLAISLLGAVLSGGGKSVETAPPPVRRENPRSAVIAAQVRFANAFAIDLQLSSWKSTGRFTLAVTQGLGGAGYRVVYAPGTQSKLELLKVTARGQGIVDRANMTSLEDKKIHSLRWTRSSNGTMSVSLDGKRVLGARDVGFRDSFDGVSLSNQGADVIVKSITVSQVP